MCEEMSEIGWNRGGLSFSSAPLHVCAVCKHQTEMTFEASTATHKIHNRSGEPVTAHLCVRCWSRLKRLDTE